jgi:hypothetical protein
MRSYMTFFISLPQVHLPGAWLIVSHLQSAPQAHMYLPVVGKDRALSHPAADSMALSPSTLVTFALTMGLPQVQFPAFEDIVLQGHLSPQLQAYTSSPTFNSILLLSRANARDTTTSAKATVNSNAVFFIPSSLCNELFRQGL